MAAANVLPSEPAYGDRPQRDTKNDRELTRLRRAYGAAGYEKIEKQNQGTYEKHLCNWRIASCLCSGFCC